MDLTASLSALQSSSVQSQISTAVAKKAMDVQRDQGQAAIALLKAATDFQGSVSAAGVDTYA